jgi:hypothetical protein
MGIQLDGMRPSDEALFSSQVPGKIGFAGVALWHAIGISIAKAVAG